MKTPAQWWADMQRGDNVIADIEARDNEHAAVIAALQRTVETLGADVLRLAADNAELEGALQLSREGIQAYCDSENAMRAQLDAGKRLARECTRGTNAHPYCPGCGKHREERHGSWCPLEKFLAAPPQPEPVKAHAYEPYPTVDGQGVCAGCNNPDGPPWHAPVVPENAGATKDSLPPPIAQGTHGGFHSAPAGGENAGTTCCYGSRVYGPLAHSAPCPAGPLAQGNAGTTCPACQGLKGFDKNGNPSADHVGRYCGICAGTGRAK